MEDKSTRAQKKTAAAWDLHRHTIVDLYHTKQLEGEDGVMELMKKNHEFSATYIPPLTHPNLN
jgi:hypothetical protein